MNFIKTQNGTLINIDKAIRIRIKLREDIIDTENRQMHVSEISEIPVNEKGQFLTYEKAEGKIGYVFSANRFCLKSISIIVFLEGEEDPSTIMRIIAPKHGFERLSNDGKKKIDYRYFNASDYKKAMSIINKAYEGLCFQLKAFGSKDFSEISIEIPADHE